MESTNPLYSQREDEISLKDLIRRTQTFGKYLWTERLFILVFGLLGAGIGGTYAIFKKPIYVGELSFVVEDSKSNPLGTYAALASQFGIDFGGGNGSGVFSGDNILEFLKSRLMVEKALLSQLIHNGKPLSLADYYIEINNLRKAWSENSSLKGLHLPANTDRKKFSLQQDSILNVIYTSIVKKNLKISKPDKKLSFISVECSTPDEIFSKAFTEQLVKEAIDFYVLTKTKRSKQIVDKLQSKADSLESLLNRKTYSVAVSQDMNLNPARSLAGVKTELIARDKIVLQTMYAEVVKNLEFSRMAMAQETPIIQIVDTPILPLKLKKLSLLKGLIFGGFLGTFLVSVCLLARLIYSEMMN